MRRSKWMLMSVSCVMTIFFLIAIVSAFLIAEVPSSPAGGNYLDLSDGVYYFAEDSPSLDALLGEEWTIEMWIYIREFPPKAPGEKWPLPVKNENISCILLKAGSWLTDKSQSSVRENP